MADEKYLNEIIKKARGKKYKGCFTCKYYSPLQNEFVDTDSEDRENPENPWVLCELNQDSDISLKINCKNWKEK